MLIVTNYEQAQKKYLKDTYKIVASDCIRSTDMKRTIVTGEFLPDPMLFSNYMNGYTSKKQYKKAYIEQVRESEGAMASILSILILYRRGDNVVLCCAEEEEEFMYLQFLAEFIAERYGIDLCSGNYVKKHGLDKLKHKIKDEKRLKKDLKEYEDLLQDAIKGAKKHKKKKKNKDKKKGKDKKKDKNKKKKRKEERFIPTAYAETDNSGYLTTVSDVSERFETVKVKKLFRKVR